MREYARMPIDVAAAIVVLHERTLQAEAELSQLRAGLADVRAMLADSGPTVDVGAVLRRIDAMLR